MQMFAEIVQQGAQLAGSVFVACLWQGTALSAVLWICLRFAPRTTAALRFTLWTAVLLLVALLPVIETTSLRPAYGSILTVDFRWSLVLAALWLALTLARAASLAQQTYRLWMLHRLATPISQLEAIQPLLTMSRRTVQLCTSSQVDRPGVIGFFAPRILIPAWLYPQLTAPELEQIILHEVEHLRRRDDWLNLLQKLALVVFPLNPVLIAIERRLCLERELACDDGVLNRTRAPRLYATCLASLAERGLDHRALSLALGALGNPERSSELSRRIQRILRRRTVASPRYARTLTAAVATVLTCGAAGLASCPQLVAFVSPAPATAAALPVTPPARTMQAVYTDAHAVAPSLVNSSFSPRKPRSTHVLRREPIRAAQAQLHKLPTTPETALLLTGWPEQESPRFLTLGADLPATGHFAVVRVDGGWLLLKL